MPAWWLKSAKSAHAAGSTAGINMQGQHTLYIMRQKPDLCNLTGNSFIHSMWQARKQLEIGRQMMTTEWPTPRARSRLSSIHIEKLLNTLTGSCCQGDPRCVDAGLNGAVIYKRIPHEVLAHELDGIYLENSSMRLDADTQHFSPPLYLLSTDTAGV